MLSTVLMKNKSNIVDLGLQEDLSADCLGVVDGLAGAPQQGSVLDQGAAPGVQTVQHHAVHLGVLIVCLKQSYTAKLNHIIYIILGSLRYYHAIFIHP